MAVQKSRCSRAKRNRRRSAKKFLLPELSFNVFSNEIHRRHFITPKGYHKSKLLLKFFKNKGVDNNVNDNK